MAEIVRMPKMSDTMTEGVIAKWHKKVGDTVKTGELMAEIETDKATMDYESFNAAVPGFNAKVNAYNAQVGTVRRLIDQFNALVASRNAIVTEQSELVKAIDTRPDTLKTQ